MEAAASVKGSKPEQAEYRLWVNEERTVLVRLWMKRRVLEVARRDSPLHTWGPPEYLTEESVT